MQIISEGKTGTGLLIERDAGYLLENSKQPLIQEAKSISNGTATSIENPYLYGVLQKCDILNRNGRIYPKDVLVPEVEKYQAAVKLGRSAGETDHPTEPVVSIVNVSFRIIEMWWEGNTLMGKIFLPITKGYINSGIISHPADKILHDIISGFQYGVSSRGVGSVKNIDNKNIVQKDFELVCWDFVTSPSTKGSWMYGNTQEAEKHIQREHSDMPDGKEINSNVTPKNSFLRQFNQYFS